VYNQSFRHVLQQASKLLSAPLRSNDVLSVIKKTRELAVKSR
jgi:hypothetical protein